MYLPLIPNEGKFFYSTLEMGESYDGLANVNTMYMNVLVGDTESSTVPNFKLGISTGGSAIELFSSDCDNEHCFVDQKYNILDSRTFGDSKVPSYQTKLSSVYEDLFDNVKVTFNGNFKTEDFRLRIAGFNKETILQDFDFSILTFPSDP